MRKIVPVAAMISAGKSKLLNVLYNINFLETKAGIGTKFVNILRYNPSITEPKFYHLRIKKEGEEYVFYKDNLSEDIIGEKKIIEENKNINRSLAEDSDFNYENIFYMTEINDSPFIRDKEYLLTHDLCDIPGLSEYQEMKPKEQPEEQIQEKKEPEKEKELKDKLEDIKKQFVYDEQEENVLEEVNEEKKDEKKEQNEIIEKIDKEIEEGKKQSKDDKKEDDIFYKIKIDENTYLSEIFKIIKKYIDGAIIILSIQNFYFESNFELIAKLHKVIEKEITNFLVILNKADLSTDLRQDINKCKGLFMKYFPDCKTFNINLNTFIPLSTFQLQNELLFDKSFKHLLRYHFYNYMAKINNEKLMNKNILCKTFIDHLRDIIKTEKGITREEIEKKVNNFNNPGIDEEIISIIKELMNDFKGNNINFGVTEEDFKKDDKNDDNEDLLNLDMEAEETQNSSNNTNIDDINPSYILKFLYIYQTENKLIPTLSEETNNLLNYFTVKKDIPKLDESKDELSEKTKLNLKIIKNLQSIAKAIKNSKFISEEISNIINEIYKTIEFLRIYDVIFIPFLGPSNAGKTTIINGMIGEDILPSDLNECTKRGIIIRYFDDHETEINIRKTFFREETFMGRQKYYFEPGKIIAKGIKSVQETVRGLNYDFADKEEDSFYYIRTKIKLFDDLKLDNSIKKMIYLIDFPGFGTGNTFEKKLYSKVMSICNSFIFVVRNSVIKEVKNKEILENIFTQARNQRNKLSSGFIQNCLFVLNNDNSQSTNKEDIENVKKDIREILQLNEKNEVNAVFFNAKYFNRYLDYFNYFFKIQKTFNDEYYKFRIYKNNLFKNPELYKDKTFHNFCGFIYKELTDKIKMGNFEKKMEKNQEFNENVKNEINETIKEFVNKSYIKSNEFPQKFFDAIGKLFSFGRNNINELSTLKESNIEEFRNINLDQINYVNNGMQEELKVNIYKVITTLTFFFTEDFTEREKDLKAFNEFKDKLDEIIQKMKLLSSKIKDEIKETRTTYETGVINSLESKKEKIDKLLKEKNWKEIKKEIDEKMKEKLKNFDNEIQNCFNNISHNSFMYFQNAKNLFFDFTDKKIVLDEFPKFKDYFLKKVSNKSENISDEISKEIRRCIDNTMSEIYKENGLMTSISSLIFDSSYLRTILDIIIKYYTKHTKYIFDLLITSFNEYIISIIDQIKIRRSLISIRYSKDQNKEWKKLCKIFTEKKEIIFENYKQIISHK